MQEEPTTPTTPTAPKIKCVVVGDGSVGKTSLLIRYAKDEYLDEYVPTVFDNYAVTIPIENDKYTLHLFDTAGQEDFEQLRRLAFSNTDVFLVCFAVDRWASFINVRESWIPELQKYCPGVPYLLVGTRIDLRNDQTTIENLEREGKSPISRRQGERMAEELQAVTYVECSALTKENVEDVFREAMVFALSDNTAIYKSSFQANIRNENTVSFSGAKPTDGYNSTTNHNNSSSSDVKSNNSWCCCCDCCSSNDCIIL